MYKEWADGQINKMKGILNSAREGHTSAVKSRIENVKQLGSVVEVTKQLFEVSKVWEPFSACYFFDHLRGYALIGNRKPPRLKRKSSNWNKRRLWRRRPSRY